MSNYTSRNKRGVISNVISLTTGSSGFPFRHRFIGNPQDLSQLSLRPAFLFPAEGDETADFHLIHKSNIAFLVFIVPRSVKRNTYPR